MTWYSRCSFKKVQHLLKVRGETYSQKSQGTIHCWQILVAWTLCFKSASARQIVRHSSAVPVFIFCWKYNMRMVQFCVKIPILLFIYLFITKLKFVSLLHDSDQLISWTIYFSENKIITFPEMAFISGRLCAVLCILLKGQRPCSKRVRWLN